jgi:DMSO reductase anchor subunit
MNMLQKRAWTNLAIVIGVFLIGIIFLSILVHINAKGNIFRGVLCLLIGVIAGVIAYIRNLSKENQIDEREKMIAQKSFMVSCYTFISFIALTSMGLFYFCDAKSTIPVYLPMLLFISGLLIAQLVESATILIWCAKEQQDG